MTPEGNSFSVDMNSIKDKLYSLDKFTISFGFSLGILAYSTVLCQMTAVPELMMNEENYIREGSPYHEHFKVPLFISNFFAFMFKWCFAMAGAMTFTQDSNLFNGLLFNKKQNDAVLCAIVIFTTFIIIPNCI